MQISFTQKQKVVITLVFALIACQYVQGQNRILEDFNLITKLNEVHFSGSASQFTYQNRIFQIQNSESDYGVIIYEMTNSAKPVLRGTYSTTERLNYFDKNFIQRDGKNYLRFAGKGGKNFMYIFTLNGDNIDLTYDRTVTVGGQSNSEDFLALPIEEGGNKHYMSIKGGKIYFHDFSNWNSIYTFGYNYPISEINAMVTKADGKYVAVGLGSDYKFFMIDIDGIKNGGRQPTFKFKTNQQFSNSLFSTAVGQNIFVYGGQTHCVVIQKSGQQIHTLLLAPNDAGNKFVQNVGQVYLGGSIEIEEILVVSHQEQVYFVINTVEMATQKIKLFETLGGDFYFASQKGQEWVLEEDCKNAHFNFYKGRLMANFVSNNYMYTFEIVFTQCDSNKYVNPLDITKCIACEAPCVNCYDFGGECSSCKPSNPPREPWNNCACPTHFSEYNGQDQCVETECHQYCKYCDPVNKQCLECHSPGTTEKVGGQCQCKAGFVQAVLDPYSDQCDEIETGQCTNTKCQQCTVNQHCYLMKADAKGYLVKGEIKECRAQCDTCYNGSQCITCKAGENREVAPNCNCKTGFAEKNGQCEKIVIQTPPANTGNEGTPGNETNNNGAQLPNNNNNNGQQQQQGGDNSTNSGNKVNNENNNQQQQVVQESSSSGNGSLVIYILVPIIVLSIIGIVGTLFYLFKLRKSYKMQDLQMSEMNIMEEELQQTGNMRGSIVSNNQLFTSNNNKETFQRQQSNVSDKFNLNGENQKQKRRFDIEESNNDL